MTTSPRADAWAVHAAWAIALAAALVACRGQTRVRLARLETQWRDRLHHDLLPRVDAAGYAANRGDTDLACKLLRDASNTGRSLLAAQVNQREHHHAVTEAVARSSRMWGERLGCTTLYIDDPLPQLTADTHRVLAEVVGESLTNVARHRPGANVRVVLAGLADEVLLNVTSRGGQVPEDPGHQGGYGVAALERSLAEIEGVIRQQPLHDGHQVSVRVPADRAARLITYGSQARNRRARRGLRSRSRAGTT